MKKYKFWKKFLLSFCVVVSLVMINLRLFVVSASANSVPDGDHYDIYSIGTPVTVNYSGLNSTLSGFVPSPNVYAHNISGANEEYKWVTSLYDYETDDYSYDFSLWYRNDLVSGGSNGILEFTNRSLISGVSINSPVYFSSFNELLMRHNFLLGVNGIKDFNTGNNLSSVEVDFFVGVAVPVRSDDGFVFETRYYPLSKTYTLTNNSFTFNFFDTEVLNTIKNTLFTFVGSDDKTYAIITDYIVDFGSVSVNSLAFDYASYVSPYLLYTYNNFNNQNMMNIYSGDSFNEVVVFEDIDWTDWLVNAIGGFMDFELVPGLSFAGMLGLLVGMSLFIVFLKIFAGG